MIKLTIMSAEMKREIEKPIRDLDEMKRKIAEQKRELCKQEIIPQIFNTLKEQIECETYSIIHDFYYSDFDILQGKDFYSKTDILEECCNIVKELLEQAGYEFSLHIYSSSWRRQSGKFCEIFVKW